MPAVLAVIPVYRPDSGPLGTLIHSLMAEHVPVVVVDDASPTTFDRDLAALDRPEALVIRHRVNRGIARSLNDGLRIARERGAEWLLTVDQDTALPRPFVAELLKLALSSPRIGVVGVQTIRDASGDMSYPTTMVDGLLTTEEVVQSGSLWSIAALEQIGGFDERLGIDAVDAAACLRLREHGYLVALAPGTHVEHRLGSARQVRVLGRTVLATGHRPERRESMMRNRIALAPAEFRQSPLHGLRTIRRVGLNAILGSTIETDRWANTKASVRGLLPRRGR